MFEVIRVERNKNYTVICNHHLQNPELSLKAKGLMTVMLSLPNDTWELSISGLAKLCKDGEGAVSSALKELEKQGYFSKRAEREKGKIVRWIHTLTEFPRNDCLQELEEPELEEPELEEPELKKPDMKNPDVAKLEVENRVQLNTYSKSITKDNKELKERNDIQTVVDAWNSAGGLPVKKVTASSTRGKMLLARINEYGIDDVLNAVNEYRLSSFLRGQNKNGFVADFEWFVKPNNFCKVLEGKYRDRKATWNANSKINGQSDLDYLLRQAGGTIYDERGNSETFINYESDLQQSSF